MQLGGGKYYWGAKPVAYYAGGVTHFEHQDWLGTERMRTSYNGTVVGSYASLPWGDGQVTTGADWDANHFATLDHDAESGTDHAQFRQYSSAQGRWMRPDPYSGSYRMRNPQSMNRYVYALNNPLSNIDPSGRDLCDWGINDETGGEDYDNDANCAADGGSPVVVVQSVSVNSDIDVDLYPASPLSSLTFIYSFPQLQYSSTAAPNNGTPQQPQQQQKKPWYCGAGNSWAHPFTAPSAEQWTKWAASDVLIGMTIAKFTKGTDLASDTFLFSGAIEGVTAANCL
jgi:RHS repeat-associated protein